MWVAYVSKTQELIGGLAGFDDDCSLRMVEMGWDWGW